MTASKPLILTVELARENGKAKVIYKHLRPVLKARYPKSSSPLGAARSLVHFNQNAIDVIVYFTQVTKLKTLVLKDWIELAKKFKGTIKVPSKDSEIPVTIKEIKNLLLLTIFETNTKLVKKLRYNSTWPASVGRVRRAPVSAASHISG